MPPKYPTFSPDLDLDALERWAYQLNKVVCRGENRHTNRFLKGLLYRASPYYRAKLAPLGIDLSHILLVARWDEWDGKQV